MQYSMIYLDEIKQLSVLNSAGKHLFIALALHTKVKIVEKEDVKYRSSSHYNFKYRLNIQSISIKKKIKFRIRSCFPSHDYLANITCCSKSYVSKGIQNLKKNGFLITHQRPGTSAIYKITTFYTVYKEDSHSVYKEDSYTVYKEDSHSVYKEDSYTVYEHNKNKEQKELSKNISIVLTEKQIKIIDSFCDYFGWHDKNYKDVLQSKLPDSCKDYLDDELILMGAYNLKQKSENKSVWTGSYFTKGIIGWIERGKGKSQKPSIHLQYFIEKVHTDILKSEKKEEITEEVASVNISDNEAQDDFNWLFDHFLKQYTLHKSLNNKTQLENLLNHNLINQQQKQQITAILQE